MINKEIDWEQRRYEVAKQLYCQNIEMTAKGAVASADELITELKISCLKNKIRKVKNITFK